MYTNESKD